MATFTGETGERIRAIEGVEIVSGGTVSTGNLVLNKKNGNTVDLGPVGGGGGVNPSGSGLFSAYRNTALILPNLYKTDIPMNGTNFNRDVWFDTTTGRYTPQVEGFYRLSVNVSLKTVFPQNTDSRVILYMDAGGAPKFLHTMHPQGEWNILSSTIIVAANGTTDSFIPQLHVSHSTDVELRFTSGDGTYFQGELIAAVPLGFSSN